MYNLEYLINWYCLPAGLLNYARSYSPYAIVTVPDNTHSGLAYQLAKKLKLPLVTDFQDLFPLSRFIVEFMEPYGWVRKFLLKKFFRLHKESDLVFYTSEGMKDFFGEHENGHVLYPVGDFNISQLPFKNEFAFSPKPIKILYAGNCYGAYGRMLLNFSRLVKNSPEIQFKIYPVGKGWSDEDINEMKAAGIYQSFMPFEKLKTELEATDAFLTVMSFEKEESPFVKTSFTTKWLDYAPYGKPIFVWGPQYSSGVVFAEKHNCGIIVTESDARHLKDAIIQTARNENSWRNYSRNAKTASEKVLNPNMIHSILVNEINKVIIQKSDL